MERKEPLTDAGHVRSASARFNQVEGVTAGEKEAAKKRIQKAAKRFRRQALQEARLTSTAGRDRPPAAP